MIVDKTYGHAAYGCAICCGPELALMDFDPLDLEAGASSFGTAIADGDQTFGAYRVLDLNDDALQVVLALAFIIEDGDATIS